MIVIVIVTRTFHIGCLFDGGREGEQTRISINQINRVESMLDLQCPIIFNHL